MYKLLSTILFTILFCKQASGRIAPSFIHPCPQLTPECLVKNIQETLPDFANGIPELGVRTLDPMHSPHEDILLPGGLKIELYNGTLIGIKTCIVDKIKIENLQVDMSVHCNITLKGRYKAIGRMLLFTLDGRGYSEVNIENLALFMKLQFEDTIRDGVEYREIKDFKIKHKFNGRVHFILTNLIRGNKQLSDTILLFLNEHSKEVVDEFGGPVVVKSAKKILENVRKFFQNVPKDELFPQ